jgi:hypothetical protein
MWPVGVFNDLIEMIYDDISLERTRVIQIRTENTKSQ